MQIYAEAESNANLFAIAEAQQYMWPSGQISQKPRAMQMRMHFDWFIPRQTEDFMSYGCCGMGQAYKPSGLHCRGVNSICGREADKYNEKPRQSKFICFAEAQQICDKKTGLPLTAPRSLYSSPRHRHLMRRYGKSGILS